MSTTSVTILLLDEEPLLRRATALLLERRGGRVTAASSAEEAAALCESRVYDGRDPRRLAGGARRGRGARAPPRGRAPSAEGDRRRRRAAHRGEAERFAAVLLKPYRFGDLVRAVFGGGARLRTCSGVFACEGAPPARPRLRRRRSRRSGAEAPGRPSGSGG